MVTAAKRARGACPGAGPEVEQLVRQHAAPRQVGTPSSTVRKPPTTKACARWLDREDVEQVGRRTHVGAVRPTPGGTRRGGTVPSRGRRAAHLRTEAGAERGWMNGRSRWRSRHGSNGNSPSPARVLNSSGAPTDSRRGVGARSTHAPVGSDDRDRARAGARATRLRAGGRATTALHMETHAVGSRARLTLRRRSRSPRVTRLLGDVTVERRPPEAASTDVRAPEA